MFQKIPDELKQRRQWVNWKYIENEGKKPTKVPYNPLTGWPASNSDPSQWVEFDTACAAVNQYDGIGFVLTNNDPYTFIDLDTYDPKLSDEDKKRHGAIAHAFQGYAELSPSGQGLHLIVKASVEAGRKRAGVEIYSSGRYMTMTGNIWRDAPIVDQQELVKTLWDECLTKEIVTSTVDCPQTDDDNAICDKAAAAVNKEKFIALWLGNWQPFYQSQSEADFALIDIIAYYTKNRDQIARIFRNSALGQRDKAKRNDYMQRMLNRAFDNQVPPVDFSALQAKVTAMAEARQVKRDAQSETVMERLHGPLLPIPNPVDESVYSVPPGLLGEVAKYIYAAAPRPVAEIALCGAMGLLSGICGRSYNINGTGLNQYLLLLAPTGSGKEAMASGISHLMAQVAKFKPEAMEFVGPGLIASAPALFKYLTKRPSFVTIGGEFGHQLQRMANPNAPSHEKAIKQAMLDLFGKSGTNGFLQPSIYSDVAKNTLVLQSPAFTFLGESAPESFYTAVDEQLISDGLLPRFTIVEYTGPQPALNRNSNCLPPEELVKQLAGLCANSLRLNQGNQKIDVRTSAEAEKRLDEFELECRNKINGREAKEVTKQIWNRAHLRSIKLSALLAVGENPYQPTISLANAEWAIALSVHNTNRLLTRFKTGDYGSISNEDRQRSEIVRVVSEYVVDHWNKVKIYTDYENMHRDKIVPMQYIQRRLSASSSFRNDKRGPGFALNAIVRNMCDCGELVELSKIDVHNRYKTTARCFVISQAEVFNA